jgi:hypothetical protein
MRVYYTATVDGARAILSEGFVDLREFANLKGVWLADCQRNANNGFGGDVTMCPDVPEDEFKQYEVAEEGLGHRMSLIPAAVLNGLPNPQVYDYLFCAGKSRAELVRAIRTWEVDDVECQRHAQEVRDAIQFFDEIGWLTPLRL